MKSLARWSFPRAAAVLSAAALGLWIQVSAASAAPAIPARPAAGNGFTISLAVSSAYPYIGQSVTVTAMANADVGPTPYYITIYSETTGAELAVCGWGATCSATVSQAAPGTQDFEAFVGDDVPGAGRPGFVLASSNEAGVTWWQFILRGLQAGSRSALAT